MAETAARFDYHPAVHHRTAPPAEDEPETVTIPKDKAQVELLVGDRTVRLTNLQKPFWPKLGVTKGDLIQYYADISRWLLPHLHDRAMVMKRYPNGAEGEFFYMKNAPTPRPEWIEICSIDHRSGNIVDFPVVQDLATLLWLINLGCIDLNQWYARCDDVDRPDYLHFDLDPGPDANFEMVRDGSLILREALEGLGMPVFGKTTGSKGMHIYIPIVRGTVQKQVWTFAKAFANVLAEQHPKLFTAKYKIAIRPTDRVLIDYNQNAWGRTLASLYSIRPTPNATVSTPVTWEEVEAGVEIGDFTMRNVPQRLRDIGDLWQPLVADEGRFDLTTVLK
jgi:bifunctional non-homologous end joining protein LigD